MNKTLLFAALCAAGISTTNAQAPTIEDRLTDLELRTSRFVSGKEKMVGGFAQLPADLRQVACQAYPTRSDSEAIAGFKDQIAFLESPDSASKLDPGQAARLATQKETVSALVPGVDCSKLP